MADTSKNFVTNEKKKPQRTPNDSHKLRKRQPPKPERGDSIIYVNSKSNIKALSERCSRLINNENAEELIIYCLGAAIPKGILLALQLIETHQSFKIETNTLSTELLDDLEPLDCDADYEIQHRTNSALRMRLFQVDLLATKQQCSSPSKN